MRHNPGPFDPPRALPRSGDLVSCDGCGRVSVHARQLALSGCCARRARVVERATRGASLRVRLTRAFRALTLRGSWT